eukprot:m.75188 g.75188  ORF g.75188 m.75188 type:complete len:542 (-) comp13969_c0_seq1:78-1703(-)
MEVMSQNNSIMRMRLAVFVFPLFPLLSFPSPFPCLSFLSFPLSFHFPFSFPPLSCPSLLSSPSLPSPSLCSTRQEEKRASLTCDEIGRYSRQLIMPRIGMPGQLALVNSKVLVVGAGGLGCPVGMYLAAAGIGTLGFVDDDIVDISNLHRQVLHTEDRVGVHKVDSIIQSLKGLNSSVKYIGHKCRLRPDNALDIMRPYDVIVDATDNAPTRYLISDACVLLGRPLVSGSALQTYGQLTVFNYDGSPCYRCLFPEPPPASTVTNCSDGGVLGAVPGFIGSLQALEVVKVLTAQTPGDKQGIMSRRMLTVDGESGMFRVIKMRERRPDCIACGLGPGKMTALMDDYETFCHMDACDTVSSVARLQPHQRITVSTLSQLERARVSIVDVRPEVEFGICALDGSINIPLRTLQRVARRGFTEKLSGAELALFDIVQQLKGSATKQLGSRSSHAAETPDDTEVDADKQPSADTAVDEEFMLITLCRRGNDSQHAVVLFEQLLTQHPEKEQRAPSVEAGQNIVVVKDVVGGLHAWSRQIDPTFPIY